MKYIYIILIILFIILFYFINNSNFIIEKFSDPDNRLLGTAENILLLTKDFSNTGTLKSAINKRGSIEIKSYNGKMGAYFNNSMSNFLYFTFNKASKFTFSYWMCAINNNNYYTSVSISNIQNWNPVFQCDMQNNTLFSYVAMPHHWNVQTKNSINYVNNWVHLTYTVDQTNFTVKQYINGNLVSNVRGTEPLPTRADTYIIGRSGDNGRAFDGYINNFYTFNYLLTDVEVQTLYRLTKNYVFSPNELTTLRANMVTKKWTELNIDTNLNMFVEFNIIITNLSPDWRNIFHFTNNNDGGIRVPASWIAPNDTYLSYCNSTVDNMGNWVATPAIGLNKETHIVITFYNGTVNIYFNSVLKSTQKINGELIKANNQTILYICGSSYQADNGFKIKNLTFGNLSDSLKCGTNKFCVGYEPDDKVYCYGSTGGCLWGGNTCNTDNDCRVKYNITSPKYTDGDQPNCTGPSGWRNPDACPEIYNRNLNNITVSVPSPPPPPPPPPVNRTRYVFSPNEFTTLRANMVTKNWPELNIDSNLSMFVEFSIIITNLSPDWRNIYHFTNNNDGGIRVPASWIAPNDTYLSVCNSTTDSNPGWTPTPKISFNTETHVVITLLNGTINIYFNSVLKSTQKLNGNLMKANDQTVLYICGSSFPADNGFKIKNLTFGNLSDSLKCGANKFCVGYEPDNKVYCYGSNGGCLWNQNSCNTDTDCRTKYDMLSPKYTDGDQPNCTSPSGWRNPDACPEIYNRSLDNKNSSPKYTFSPNDWTIIKPNIVSKKWIELNVNSNFDMFIEFDILIKNINYFNRNIFHFNDTGSSLNKIFNCYVTSNDTNIVISFISTSGPKLDLMSPRIGRNTKTHVVITVNKNNVNFYFDSMLKTSKKISDNTINNLKEANNDTTLYISSPWDRSDDGIKIKNLTFGNLSDSLRCGKNKFCVGYEPDDKVYCYGSNDGCLWDKNTCNTDDDCKVKYSMSSPKFTNGDQPKCTLASDWRTPDACPEIYKTDYDKTVDNQSCNYQLNNSELKCYKQRYPNDLSKLTDSQLQEHWSTIGCNEERDNQCPAPQKTSGLYEYNGCFNSGSEGLINDRGKVSSVDECNSIAESNNEMFFGIKNYGECWTGNDEKKVLQYGENLNGNSCGIMGKSTTQNIYKRSKAFPPPLPPIPKLTNPDFSENFENQYDKKYIENNNYIIFLIIFIIIIIFYIFFNK